MARKPLFIKLFRRHLKLADLDIDALQRERLRLKREEARIAQQVDHTESAKSALFEQAVAEGSGRRKVMIARRIKELDSAAKHDDAVSRLVSKQVRILSGIIKLKQNQELQKRLGVVGLLKRLDVSELAAHLEKAAIDGEITEEKLESVLLALEDGDTLRGHQEDPDIEEILGVIEEVAATGAENRETATSDGLARVNQILGRDLESPEREPPPEAV